jgi:hypothetical protein
MAAKETMMLKSFITIVKTEPVAIMALTLRQHVTPVATLNARAAAA